MGILMSNSENIIDLMNECELYKQRMIAAESKLAKLAELVEQWKNNYSDLVESKPVESLQSIPMNKIDAYDQVKDGKFYWLKSKHFGSFRIAQAVDNTVQKDQLRLGEQWCIKDNHKYLFENWEIYGPIPQPNDIQLVIDNLTEINGLHEMLELKEVELQKFVKRAADAESKLAELETINGPEFEDGPEFEGYAARAGLLDENIPPGCNLVPLDQLKRMSGTQPIDAKPKESAKAVGSSPITHPHFMEVIAHGALIDLYIAGLRV
jgi:hypothetical protein